MAFQVGATDCCSLLLLQFSFFTSVLITAGSLRQALMTLSIFTDESRFALSTCDKM